LKKLEGKSGAGLFLQKSSLQPKKAFVLHAASLGQAFAHCRRFSTAASRRSEDRISIPLLGAVLSHPLPVIALVSHYLTNKLMGRRPLANRQACAYLYWRNLSSFRLSGISPDFSRLCLC